jgi:prepilin-type N-terminal cleavage/methylation domain-containing protein
MRVQSTRGFSLVEALVALAVMGIFGSLFSSYIVVLNAVKAAREKLTLASIANEKIEVINNMPYGSVGTVGGVPSGSILQNEAIQRNENTYTVHTTVRNIDDPYDGVIDGTVDDTSPQDYKLVEIHTSCTTCVHQPAVDFSGRIIPPSLESTTTNGALVIRVTNAAGTPLPDATVHIVNSSVTPAIDITDVTNVSGLYTAVGVPPSVQRYAITVSKSGYSTEQTLPVGATGNPNPTKPHATVTASNSTQVSFAIDQTSTLRVTTSDADCNAIPSLPLTLMGSKTIGLSPTIYLYNQNLTTPSGGLLTVSPLVWDAYTAVETSNAYTLAGTIPVMPASLLPNATQDLRLVLTPQSNRNLLVSVVSSTTGIPVSLADVRLQKGSYDATKITGVGVKTQTDWSGGGSQALFTDQSKYFTSDGNVDMYTSAGDLTLSRSSGVYSSSGTLTSSTFDVGTATNFSQISWALATQPSQTGTNSVRFQIATNTDNTTWTYKGPDSTSATYYTTPGTTIHDSHDGDRYLRYKIFLQSANTAYTPTISNISFTYTTECTPPGQVVFTGRGNGNHTLIVSKAGYVTSTSTVSMSTNEKQVTIPLSPN